MKKVVSFLSVMLSGLMVPVGACAENITAASTDTLFLTLKDGSIQAFPKAMIKDQIDDGTHLIITTIHDKAYKYKNTDLKKRGEKNPIKSLPKIEEDGFKLNNKYNDQLHQDFIAEVTGNVIKGALPGLGKWLTPEYTLDTENAYLYDGLKKVVSTKTRQSYAKPVTLVAALENCRVYRGRVIEEAVLGEVLGEYTYAKIPLKKENFSTNAPTNRPEEEDFDKLLDGNKVSFFHTTWGGGEYTPLAWSETGPGTVWPWISIDLPYKVTAVRLYYATRADQDRTPYAFDLQASSDKKTWKTIKSFSIDDTDKENKLPKEQGSEFTSGVIQLGGEYKFLRLQLKNTAHKNYFSLTELAIESVTATDPSLVGTKRVVKPAVVEADMYPLGRTYTTAFTWLSEQFGASVPTVKITTDDGEIPGRPDKETYHDGYVVIDGKNVFPSMEQAMQIKGRGNTSWDNSVTDGVSNPKNPYRLKFDKKQKPLGMKNGKNWVLLANKQNHSMLSNAFGMKIARLVGTEAANHMTPVDLYINGDYRGSYNLTEKVGISNNSVELEDETWSVLLEMDQYYDQNFKFTFDWNKGDDNNADIYAANVWNWNDMLPCNVKDPELKEGANSNPNKPTQLSLEMIQESAEKLFEQIQIESQLEDTTGVVTKHLDLESLARYLMVNELILNFELHHPKSIYLYNADVYSIDEHGDPKETWHFGPVWDLDWAYGYELNGNYGTCNYNIDFWNDKRMENSKFLDALRACGGEEFEKAYFYVWHKFVKEGQLDEFLEFCDDYYKYAKSSFERNADKWGDGKDYETVKNNNKAWLKNRAEYIYNGLKKFDLPEPEESYNPNEYEIPIADVNLQPVVPVKPEITSKVKADDGDWQNVNTVTVEAGSSVTISLEANVEDGAWSWTGPDGFKSTKSEITLSNLTTKQSGKYTVTFTSKDEQKVTVEFTVAVSDSEESEGKKEDDKTGVEVIEVRDEASEYVDVRDLNGRLVARNVRLQDVRSKLSNGIYIVNGKKLVVRK